MKNSRIEWTHHTFSPWRGCTKVSAGCANCYAETMSKRNPSVLGDWGTNGTRVIATESYWRQPISWNKEAEAAGERRRVFCGSLCDVFEIADCNEHDTIPKGMHYKIRDAQYRLFDLIDSTPMLDWLLLTKRPENIACILDCWVVPLPDNVWIGTSVEDQKAANARIPHLLSVHAKVRFLSCEPLLGPIKLPVCGQCGAWGWHRCEMANEDMPIIHWIIAGGESGPHARPMHSDWVRSLRDQAKANDIAFLFKQWGEWLPHDQGQWVTSAEYYVDPDSPDAEHYRIGKKAAGRLLDGRLWDEYPGENP